MRLYLAIFVILLFKQLLLISYQILISYELRRKQRSRSRSTASRPDDLSWRQYDSSRSRSPLDQHYVRVQEGSIQINAECFGK